MISRVVIPGLSSPVEIEIIRIVTVRVNLWNPSYAGRDFDFDIGIIDGFDYRIPHGAVMRRVCDRHLDIWRLSHDVEGPIDLEITGAGNEARR